MIVGKLAFFAWALIVPMFFHRWWVVLLFYGAAAFLVGSILAVVFQLAHCLEEADFPRLPAGPERVERSFSRRVAARGPRRRPVDSPHRAGKRSDTPRRRRSEGVAPSDRASWRAGGSSPRSRRSHRAACEWPLARAPGNDASVV